MFELSESICPNMYKLSSATSPRRNFFYTVPPFLSHIFRNKPFRCVITQVEIQAVYVTTLEILDLSANHRNTWIRRLYWDGAYIHARAKASDAVRNPYVQSFVRLLLFGLNFTQRLITASIP
jgi:hypothetical protein